VKEVLGFSNGVSLSNKNCPDNFGTVLDFSDHKDTSNQRQKALKMNQFLSFNAAKTYLIFYN